MENIQWIFSGIGTEILSLAIGAIVGGLVGYKIGISQSGKQKQRAGSNSKQQQELKIKQGSQTGETKTVKNTIRQSQRAGKNSEQVQIGGMHDGE